MTAAARRGAVHKTRQPLNQAGFWAAVLTTVFSVAFTAAFAVDALSSPPSSSWAGMAAYAASFSPVRMALVLVPSLLLAPSFVALVACIHGGAPEEKKVWTRIGLGFAIMYAVVATINYTIQLIVVRGNLYGEDAAALGLFVMGNPRSVFWALALVGYNFYMALATLLTIPALGSSRLDQWIRLLFSLNAAASFVAAINSFITLDTYHPLGLVASAVWCLAFPATTALLAVRFRRAR